MKKHDTSQSIWRLSLLVAILAGLSAFVFAIPMGSVEARQPAQVVTDTPTFTATATITNTVAPGTVTVTPTITGTLPTPTRTATVRVIVPSTGADLTRPDKPARAGISTGTWVAVWLVGLLLVGYGFLARKPRS